MAQHREKVVHTRTCENMVQTSASSHDIKRDRTTSRDDRTTLYNLGHRQDIVLGPSMAATSYNIARLCTIHPDGPRSPKFRPSQVVERCLKARCTHTLRYLKLNVRPSHNVVRGRTTITQDVYEKAVRCLSLIFSGENMYECRMNSYDVVR